MQSSYPAPLKSISQQRERLACRIQNPHSNNLDSILSLHFQFIVRFLFCPYAVYINIYARYILVSLIISFHEKRLFSLIHFVNKWITFNHSSIEFSQEITRFDLLVSIFFG